jgi:adhesin/invasin
VNFQVPYETKAGSASIVVTVLGLASNPVTVPVTAAAPGLFLAGTAPAVQNYPSYALNSSSSPIAAGGTIIAYLTGTGAVSPAVADGAQAPISTLTYTTITPTATIATTAAQVTFSGLAPGFVGLTQVDITVPSSLTTGSYPLVITYSGQSTVAGTIWVK